MALSWGPLPCELFEPLALSHGALADLILDPLGIEEKKQWHCKMHVTTRFLEQTWMVNPPLHTGQDLCGVAPKRGSSNEGMLDERRNEIISAIRFHPSPWIAERNAQSGRAASCSIQISSTSEDAEDFSKEQKLSEATHLRGISWMSERKKRYADHTWSCSWITDCCQDILRLLLPREIFTANRATRSRQAN